MVEWFVLLSNSSDIICISDKSCLHEFEWLTDDGLSGIVSIAFFPFILYNTFVDFALFFGKSIQQLVEDGIKNKLAMISEESQVKLQDTMQKIVIDSEGGLVCIIV